MSEGVFCNVAVHASDRALVSDRKKVASLNFPVCVRFLSYHLSVGLWVQPPRPRPPQPPHGLHFPAHLRYCWCACFSFPCCSSGWALYRIRMSVLFSTSLNAAVQRRSAFLRTPLLHCFCSLCGAAFFYYYYFGQLS